MTFTETGSIMHWMGPLISNRVSFETLLQWKMRRAIPWLRQDLCERCGISASSKTGRCAQPSMVLLVASDSKSFDGRNRVTVAFNCFS